MADTDGRNGKRVLIAMNGSNHSTNAFEWYVTSSLLDTDELVLIYCTETSPDDSSSKTEEKVQQVLSSIQYVADKYRVKHKIERVQGSAGEAIVKASKDFEVTLIVAGSRGHSKLRRVILGSITDYVVKHSTVPVIIVKYDEQSQQKVETVPLTREDDDDTLTPHVQDIRL